VSAEIRRREDPPPLLSHDQITSREQFVASYAATANDFLAVREFADRYGLEVIAESAAKRTIVMVGTVAAMSAAFGVTLQNVRVGENVYRQRTGPITLPADLSGIVLGVFGLDNRPQAKPHFRSIAGAVHPRAGAHPLSPLEVAQVYNFPPGLDGSGQTIAIIELGGGFVQSDLNTYFQGLGLPVPTVTAVPVLGGANNPGVDPNADGEVMLDIEVAGAVAPAANQLVYFAKNDGGQGFLAAVKAAIHDAPALPAAISISWGNPESEGTLQSMQAFERAFQDAAHLGVPVFVASGDDGSSDGISGLNVDFPASAPHAVGCGGTRLDVSGATRTNEVVWNSQGASGGGVSAFFPKPSYQSTAKVPPPPGSGGGRGVPDVSGNAAPESAYKIRVDGQDVQSWGTSAVAPLWSGLTARFAQSLGRPVGFLPLLIYSRNVSSTFRDITQGNNDASGQGGPYNAGPGWDPCTGLGSPDGVALLAALRNIHTTGSTGVSVGPTPAVAPLPHPGRGPIGTKAPFEMPAPVTPPPMIAAAPVTPAAAQQIRGDGSVAIVGVLGITAVMGMVAAAGIVATVALSKDKS
jgi:kumamolisin